MDANNVSWGLLPRYYLGPLAEGDIQANAFVFALGFAVVLLVLYAMNKMKMLSDAFAANTKGWPHSSSSGGANNASDSGKQTWRDRVISALKQIG